MPSCLAIALLFNRSRVMAMFQSISKATGLRAAALASGWHRRSDADIVVATAEGARAAVERSALKLDGLQAFVLVDGNTQLGDAKDALVAVMASVPRDLGGRQCQGSGCLHPMVDTSSLRLTFRS